MEMFEELKFIENFETDISARLKQIYNCIFILTISDNDDISSNLSKYLGELAAVMPAGKSDGFDAELICDKLFNVFVRSNFKIALRLKNFFEIVCAINDDLFFWISKKTNMPRKDEENTKCFVSQIVTICRIKKGEIAAAENEVDLLYDNFLALRELSMYYNFTGNYIKSLEFINKAINNSPNEMKRDFESARKEILKKMEM